MALRALSSRSPAAYFFCAETISSPSNLVQLYISRSTDPYLNLSIEHFLLQKSHPDSVVLLLYTNRPCIVIGRNQNPWVEVNHGLINQPRILSKLRAELDSTNAGVREEDHGGKASPTAQDVDADDVLLVRRRSGGGTVFHDAGNVNYSVIGPPASFDRDKHAEMVVRALQGLGRGQRQKTPLSVRVNERHDIVLDVVPPKQALEEEDTGTGTTGDVKTFKISGSAYKLTRTRSLHHGTCLLSSPHLPFLGRLLRSPAAPYIKARGVESVRSPVRNVGVPNAAFEDAVVGEFLAMYGNGHGRDGRRTQGLDVDAEIIAAADVEYIPEIQAGVAELRSLDWIYAQTPQFVFSSHPTTDDPRPRPDLPTDLPPCFFPPTTTDADRNSIEKAAPGLQMTVRHGQITEVVVAPSAEDHGVAGNTEMLVKGLKDLHLHRVDDWCAHVGDTNKSVGRWLNRLFGISG